MKSNRIDICEIAYILTEEVSHFFNSEDERLDCYDFYLIRKDNANERKIMIEDIGEFGIINWDKDKLVISINPKAMDDGNAAYLLDIEEALCLPFDCVNAIRIDGINLNSEEIKKALISNVCEEDKAKYENDVLLAMREEELMSSLCSYNRYNALLK